MTNSDREGGCLCGALRFVAKGTPNWVAHCHCPSCRKATAAALATYASYPIAQVSFTQGEPKAYTSSPGVTRGFCGTCGTPISYQGERWPGEIHLFLCTFDTPESLRPQLHAYTAHQLNWLKLDDGLPCNPGTDS